MHANYLTDSGLGHEREKLAFYNRLRSPELPLEGERNLNTAIRIVEERIERLEQKWEDLEDMSCEMFREKTWHLSKCKKCSK